MRGLGIGIIGAGRHGERYVRHLAEVPGTHLAAVCRRDRVAGEALAARHGCLFHGEWRELVDDPRVDAVVVVVPPVHHRAIAEAAARARKPVLIEKPLATTLDDARRIVAAVVGSGITAMVGQTLRFDATVEAVRAHVDVIAPLHGITLIQRFEPSPLAWLDRRAESGGGVLLHTGVHSIDLLRVLSRREITEVSCFASRIATHETEDNFIMLARLADSPVLAHVAGSRALGGRTGLIELAGAGGQIVADHVRAEGWLVRGGERGRLPIGERVATVREALRAFVASVTQAVPVPITVVDGARAVAIIDACYRSAAGHGAPATVESI
jgi:predicted dehydrogenase